MANQSLNVPATMDAKLSLTIQQNMARGKAFDENVFRRVYGMEPVEGRPPLIITEDMAKSKEYQSLSSDAIAEIDRQAAGANQAEIMERLARVEAELAERNAQIAELTGNEVQLPQPVPSVPAENPDEGEVGITLESEGLPNKEWKRKEIVEWNAQQGFPPVPKQGVAMKKLDLIELVLSNVAMQEGNAA